MWSEKFLIPLLLGTGVIMTLRLRLIQWRGFVHAWQLISGKYDRASDPGEITHFQALSAALSATIGTGNIAGVATAIALGGPGAVFWMWITALLGMSLKYSSCLLALKYRQEHEDGTISGGPMHFLTIGLKQKWLGWLFALFTIIASFGIGNMVQANSVASPLYDNFGIPKIITGLVLAAMTGMVIFGGIKRIASVTKRVVPFMSLLYIVSALIILIMHVDAIPAAFKMIIYYAFNPHAATGGAAGAAIMLTMRYGIARGLFSNESGLGSAPMAHAAAKTSEPVREGLVAMLGPVVDTLIICTMTALVILVTGAWELKDEAGKALIGATLSTAAFDIGLPAIGKYVVMVGMILFAFSTLITWPYYGDRSTEFIFGPKAVKYYRAIHMSMIPAGAVWHLEMVWNIADIMNALMAIPNLIGILFLSGTVVRETRLYFDRIKSSPH